MSPDYKTKSQTAFGVAIICIGFVLETLQYTRLHPNAATIAMLSILSVTLVGTSVAGVVWHRRDTAQARD